MSRWKHALVTALTLLAGLGGVHAAAADARAGDAGAPFAYREQAWTVRTLALEHRQYSGDSVIPRRDTGVHDAAGVRMRRKDGVLVDLPRGQATYGLLNLNSYRVSGDRFYLERSLAQARRLVDDAVAVGEAWFVPTPVRCGRHGLGEEPVGSPYYSALAQGRTLLFFSRLAAVTGDERWRTRADRVFAAFLLPLDRRGPLVVTVDEGGYVWLQEWPWAGYVPDDTLNGHISAAFGIYEYYCLTRDARALGLLRGAATTALHYLPRFRRPGWISRYCLAHSVANANYHDIHVHQLLWLYTITGEPAFARYADLLEADYPDPPASGQGVIAPGTCSVLGLSGGEAVRRVTVPRESGGRVVARQRLRGDGVFLRFASGPFAGGWVEERPGRVYLAGAVVQLRYYPARAAALAGGRTYVGVRLGQDGRSRSEVTIAGGAGLAVDRGAVVDGYPSVRIAGGAWDGYWVRLGPGVTVR